MGITGSSSIAFQSISPGNSINASTTRIAKVPYNSMVVKFSDVYTNKC